MKVTDKQYSMDKNLIRKLDLICDRCTGEKRFDNLIIGDGNEGYGKTTLMLQCAYYCAWKTGRKFGIENVFFDIDEMIKFAQTTEEQIIDWDEAALAALANEWQNKHQKKLIKLMMISRKKRHIWIFNIPKIFKLNEYLTVDRAIALVHVYAKNENELGMFAYYKKKSKDELFYDWRKTKKRNYKKYYTFRGRFSKGFHGIIDDDEYEAKKDFAIMNMDGGEALNKREEKLIKLQYNISQLKGINKEDLAKQIGVNVKTIFNWQDLPSKYPDFLGKDGNRQ